jgi:hypothetical protein
MRQLKIIVADRRTSRRAILTLDWNHLCAGKLRLSEELKAEDAVATGPVHENGLLNASMVSVQRFHGCGGRPVFGLWASYSVAASHLHRDSALARVVQIFRSHYAGDSAGFSPASRLTNPNQGLTCTRSIYMWGTLHLRNAVVLSCVNI